MVLSGRAVFCIITHVALILLHIVIIVLQYNDVFETLVFPIETHAVISLGLQAFATVYCAVLLLLTQSLALQGLLQVRQTLSALHDKSSAWLGLGSALLALVRQRKLRTDFWGVTQIVLYLLFIFILHITIPSTFILNSDPVISYSNYPTTLAHQHVSLNAELFSIIPAYDVLETIGVWDNMIYDVIPYLSSADGLETVIVNRTTFSVDCAALSDAKQTAFQANGGSSSQPAYVFNFGSDKYTASITPMPFDTLQTVSLNGSLGPATVVIASTIPLVDSTGKNDSVTEVNPGWTDTQTEDPISAIYLVACNINAKNSTIGVNPLYRQIGTNLFPIVAPNVTWHNWTDPGVPSDPLLAVAAQLPTQAPPGLSASLRSGVVIANTTQSVPYPGSILDEYLLSDVLATRKPGASGKSNSTSSITIGELDHSLERAIAAIFWFYTTADLTKMPELPQRPQPLLKGEASIPIATPRVTMFIDPFTVYIGLASSCLLLALAVSFIHRSRRSAHDLGADTSGVLQIAWLLGSEPQLTAVEQPALDTLRVAGMYEVDPGAIRRTKLSKRHRQTDSEDVGDMRYNPYHPGLRNSSDSLQKGESFYP